MKVIVTSEAAEDIAAADEWWREHRADAPRSIAIDVAEALEALSLVGPTTPVFRRIGSAAEIRRVHVPRVHKHLYFVVHADHILVLAAWGAVRGVLPALRARLSRT